MVTTKQKLTVNTQKRKRKEYKHTTKESHQNTKEKSKRRKKGTERNYKNSQKTINKMSINTYLSIITFNVNGLNSSIKRNKVLHGLKQNKTNKQTKTRSIYMQLRRDSLQR